ncbi:MAG: hypothetical protein KY445_13585 [Armatimonadetes bacterium]|nr:hypothetical protein [Armatimonadota bacterium]
MNTHVLEISISPEDIAGAGPGIIANPIATALSRATGARWRVWDGRIAQEMCAPYRVVSLPENVVEAWQTTDDFSKLPPFSFQIELQDEEKFAA